MSEVAGNAYVYPESIKQAPLSPKVASGHKFTDQLTSSSAILMGVWGLTLL